MVRSLFATPTRTRRTFVAWLYLVVLGHVVGGLLLTWASPAGHLDAYLHWVDNAFWTTPAPAPAAAQQRWWFALFGATLQSYGIAMFALVHIGQRQRSAAAWGWLLLGIGVWAPQDIWLSASAGVWINVLADLLALCALVPPLLWLISHDRQVVKA